MTGSLKPKSVALIGVGLMGIGIGHNILNKGYELYLLEGHSKKNLEILKGQGAKILKNIADICSSVATIILCLPSSSEVEEICYINKGLLENVQFETLILDCTTAWPKSTQKLSKEFLEKGVTFLDSPLTRTPLEAMQGRLNCLLGGDKEAIEKARPILSCFCENIFEAGPIGSGNLIKLINNGFTLGIAAIVGEILKVGIEAGIDLLKLREIASKGGANNPQFQGFMSWLLDGDNDALKFSFLNATKDIRYLSAIANETNIDTPLIDKVHITYQKASEKYGDSATLPSLCGQKAGTFQGGEQ